MGRIWKDGKLVGVVGKGRNCRSGCVFPDGDDEPFGFGVGTAGCKGTSQDLMGDEDFADADDRDLRIGNDRRVYGKRHGLIECWAHVKPDPVKPLVYVSNVGWERFPPKGHLAWLFYNFFREYTDREVVMLMGERLDGRGWLYHVPEQVGTCGSVKWAADDEEMNEFQRQAQWIGTIHSHPGNCCKPSQTDIDDWAEPEKSGMHVVLGRDGSFTVNGAIAERTFELYFGQVYRKELWFEGQIEYQTSRGRSLEELLKKPKPVAARIVRRGAIHVPGKPKGGQDSNWSLWNSETGLPLWHDDEKDGRDFVEETLDVVGALPLLGEDNGIPVLRIVEYNGQFHALTLSQYAELAEWCRGVCPVPKSKRLRLRGVRRAGE